MKSFSEVLEAVKGRPAKKVVVAAAHDEPVLEAVKDALAQKIAEFVLIGDCAKIKALAANLNMDLAGRGRPNASLWAMVPALAINGALSVWLVPRHGAQGAAIASSLAYAAGGVGMMLVYCRHAGIRMGVLWRYQRSDFDFIRQRWARNFPAGGRH